MARGRSIAEYNDAATPEERAERARKAGKASAEARRTYRRQRDLARQVMAAQVDDAQIAARLHEMGMDDSYNLAVSDRPIKALDLSGMTDEELEALADQADG